MLQKMNERIKGIFAWIVILFISFTFVLFGVEYYIQSRQSGSSSVAEVNGQAISTMQFESGYKRVLQQMSPQERIENDAKIKKEVLESLIMNSVLAQAARHAGLSISEQQAYEVIAQLPALQESGHFSTERYHQLLAAAYYTPETFLQEVMQGMLVNQQRFGIIGSAFVLPSEIERYARFFFEKRSYAYLDLPMSVLENKVVASDAEAQRYYEQHARQFDIPPRIQIAYLLLSQEALKSQVQVSEEEMLAYYRDNQTSFTQPPRWKVAHLLFAFPKKEDQAAMGLVSQKAEKAYTYLSAHPAQFSEWASKHSDDLLSAQHGGELPWIVGGNSPLDTVLVTLTKPGDLSKPYRTEKGYELFKLLAYEPPMVQPFERVKSNIRDQLKMEKVQMLYGKQVESLNELSYQTPETLEPAAQALKLSILHSQPFSKTSAEEPLTQLPQVIRAAFNKDVFELGNNSEVIQLDDGKVMVLRVEKKLPSLHQSFDAVKAAIIKQLKLTKAKALAEKVVTELNQGSVDPSIASFPWHEEPAVTREVQTNHPFIHDIAFTLPSVNQVKGVFLPNGGYVMVKLKSKEPGQWKMLTDKQRADFQQRVAGLMGKLDDDLYAQELMKQAKIQRN